mgnify:FL=1|tara:strand:+ start:249 stop:1073 length:825 start_codon:yes stop_codon:yes gene_type:complete
MDNRRRILFITPISHLKNFYGELHKKFKFVELLKPTYSSVKKILPQHDILFCAPNHQTFTIDEDLIKDSDLECIVTPSTGLNHIDVDSVPIVSIKNDEVLENIWSTAEHTLYLILSIVRKIKPTIELHDKTLGIIGYGRLGKMVEKLCTPLFKKVVCVDKNNSYEKLKDIDILSIHIDLNPTTYQMINKDFINQLNKSVYIVNTSRGEVVNENDINDYLKVGKVKGYATDVLQNEYNDEYSVLENNPNVLITPHIAGVTIDAQEKAYQRVLEKI